MQKWLSLLTIGIGLVLMTMKIYVDSEPGALPLILVLLGVVWYWIERVRTGIQKK